MLFRSKKIKTIQNDNKKLNITKETLLTSSDNTLTLISSCDKLIVDLFNLYSKIDNISFIQKKHLINSSISKILANGLTGTINIKFNSITS